MKHVRVFLLLAAVILCVHYAEAGTLEFGERIGYGVLDYTENSSTAGSDIDSDADLRTVLFRLSVEYYFTEKEDLFFGSAAEWVWGTEDDETWDENGIEVQNNDLRIFGQNYDLRFGYRNRTQEFSYKLYALGGWDGIHFERDNFELIGTTDSNEVTEDFSLWRGGVGLNLGYQFGKWAIEGSAEYAYYLEGTGENSERRDVDYDVDGERIDLTIGISREVIENLYITAGGTYIKFDLDIDQVDDVIDQADSELEVTAGVISLTYEF